MGIYIICPYFKRERKKSITCEDTIRSYTNRAEKRVVLKDYCSSRWKDCPYAKALNQIYASDIPESEVKELIMEHTIEQQKAEINKLMRENGQLSRKVKTLEEQIADRDQSAEKTHDQAMKRISKLEKEIERRNEVEKENHKMYRESLERKNDLIKAKDENIKWLESLAAAFLVVAYGEEIREVRMTKDKIMKLMTDYTISYRLDEDGEAFIFNFEKVVKS